MSLLPPNTQTAKSSTIHGVMNEQYVCVNTRTTTAPIVVLTGYLTNVSSSPEWCGEESLRPSIPPLLGRRPSGPRLPGADPPGSAYSTCAHRLRGLPKPPVFFRLQERGLSSGRQITLGRILTKRCEPNSSQQEQGKSQVALHLNEPTTTTKDGSYGCLGLLLFCRNHRPYDQLRRKTTLT